MESVAYTYAQIALLLSTVRLILSRPKKQLETIKGISEQKADKLLKEGMRLGNRTKVGADRVKHPSSSRWVSLPPQKCTSVGASSFRSQQVQNNWTHYWREALKQGPSPRFLANSGRARARSATPLPLRVSYRLTWEVGKASVFTSTQRAHSGILHDKMMPVAAN